jgi:hypothetical protein
MSSDHSGLKDSEANQALDGSESRQDEASALTQTALRPTVQAAFTLHEYSNRDVNLDLPTLVDCLSEQAKAISSGDTTRAEAMLTAQAHTLDAIFNTLARRAISCKHMSNLDSYLKLALRAQSQCRATWEAVATIKNPPVVGYVRQANIAHGPQQVNNASPGAITAPHAGENPNSQSKLLETKDGERLDPGTACTPGRADPAMATVGEVDRAKNRRG